MVKVERGKIMIKVGGGYLSIDEFLQQYTPAELAAFERQDPLLRFSAKVAMQKTLTDKKKSDGRKKADAKTLLSKYGPAYLLTSISFAIGRRPPLETLLPL